MPELAEVEFQRKRWDPGLGQRVESIFARQGKRVFRRTSLRGLIEGLTGARLGSSHTHGKQMLFVFSGTGRGTGSRSGTGVDTGTGSRSGSLAVHLGMTGSLRVEPRSHRPAKHDHLILTTGRHSLVFSDPRLFGELRWHDESAPDWWRELPPQILDPEFTLAHMNGFLDRRARSPIKAALLDQSGFPGIGNWMADEILWRAGIHPRRSAGSLDSEERAKLRRSARWLCRTALETIGEDDRTPARTWLFQHRWQDGGICPRTRVPLVRETIGGRTTCWSPALQPEPGRSKGRPTGRSDVRPPGRRSSSSTGSPIGRPNTSSPGRPPESPNARRTGQSDGRPTGRPGGRRTGSPLRRRQRTSRPSGFASTTRATPRRPGRTRTPARTG